VPASHAPVGDLLDVADLADTAGAADRRVVGRLGRLLSHLENTANPGSVLDLFPPIPDATRVVGITGPPGAGKSTLVAALVASRRGVGRRVAVLAVDPSSQVSGGALLGDRIRMQALGEDPGVFVRSVANRGHLGGLAVRLPVMTRALSYAGYDEIVVETVGVGQSETAVRTAVDTAVVVLCPGQGDAVQAAKAGVLEIADTYVVNKADLPAAGNVVRDVRSAVLYGVVKTPDAWLPKVVTAIASTGEIADLVEALDAHAEWLRAGPVLRQRRRSCIAGELQGVLDAYVTQRLGAILAGPEYVDLAERVESGGLPRATAIEAVIAELTTSLRC
jgi:LAO/AO transport system kinase